MNDKDDRAPDEAFWEDEGGDRTITSPFDPRAHGAVAPRSPVSQPPNDEDEATKVGAQDPALLRRLAQPKTEPVAFGALGSVLPSALPSSPPPEEETQTAPSAAAAVAGRAHVVVGEGAVGDEATLAVAAPSSQGTNDIAAALAATLGPGWNDAVPPSSPGSSPNPSAPWGAAGAVRPAAGGPVPHASPHAPPHAFGASPTSPAASTLGGLPPASSPFGPGSSPDALRNLSPGAMPAAYPHPGSGAMPVPHPAAPPHAGMPGAWPPPPPGFPYGGPAPHAPLAPPPPAVPAAAPRTQLTLLVVVGVVCITIFVVGVVLFVRTNL